MTDTQAAIALRDFDMIINTLESYSEGPIEDEFNNVKTILSSIETIRVVLHSKLVEAIEGFNEYNRRECFADSSDGLSAYITYSQLNEEVLELRKQSKPVDVESLKKEVYDYFEREYDDMNIMDLHGDTAIEETVDCLHAKGYLNTVQWQDISTAPRDGVDIWGFWKNTNGEWQGILHWDNEYHGWWLEENCNFLSEENYLTHWRYKPRPPEDTE